MQYCVLLFRSLVFYIVSFVTTCILFLPAFCAIIANKRIMLLYISKSWVRFVLYLLEVICKLKVRATGLEHIQNQPLVIASKQQSALETLFLYIALIEPKYVLKSSLQYLPFLGMCFTKLGMIFINRTSPISAIKTIKSQAKKLLEDGKSIIIFPEGTRVPYGAKGKYSPGVAAIYESCDFDIVPVSLNSGKYWGRNSIIKYPGECHINFLPPVPKNLSKNEFMIYLEQSIEGCSGD